MSEMHYYDTSNPCRVCGARIGERCVNTGDAGPGHRKGADRDTPHVSMGDRTWDASWSAGYAAGIRHLQVLVEMAGTSTNIGVYRLRAVPDEPTTDGA